MLDGPRRAGLRPAGRGLALLYFHIHHAARPRGLRPARQAARRPRPPEPARRDGRGRQRPRSRVPVLRRAASAGRAPRHDHGRAGAAVPRGAGPAAWSCSVVRMRGWRRGMAFEDTGLPWVAPVAEHADRGHGLRLSGRLPRRGNEPLRGPRHDPPVRARGRAVAGSVPARRQLARERLPGVRFRPAFFTPTFQKHAGAVCGGVQVHVTDRRRFPAFLTYLLLIAHARAPGPEALRLARAALRVRARQAADRHPVRERARNGGRSRPAARRRSLAPAVAP